MNPRTPSKRKANGKTVKATKIERGYAVYSHTIGLLYFTVQQHACDAIAILEHQYGSLWSRYMRKGYACLPVEIRVLKKE